ncbi:NADP-dependent oxidoreductase domain-containing protein [Aspergillus taichungensis]|uniref:D-xylose reductase [NAD(P)H] n=1 Tax=Aspergillus taichungensis TaxID=482145 RepID=A0A2J5I8I1_9EURO|nr:NADP-dependent oxidoreductase domain-containing protein [Aspergillus taichungensis]
MGSESRYQVALVGLGARGYQTWFECLRQSSSIAVSAVCDSKPATLEAFAARHPSVPAYLSLEALLQAQRPDFAIVSVPNRLHPGCIAQLAAAGVPVLKEKPVAESVADFQQLCRYNVPIGVVFQRRWQARYTHLKSFLPQLGRILSVRATLAGKYDPPLDGWRVMDNVGTFEDLGVHMLDILVWLLGRPSSVLGHQAEDGPPHARDRESHVSLRWDASGIVGHLHVSEVATRKEEGIVLRGTAGSLHLDGHDIIHRDTRGRQTFHLAVESYKEDAIQAMCQDFGDYVVRGSGPFSTSIARMGDTLAAVEAVNASFASHQLQPVQPVPPGAKMNSHHDDMARHRFLLNTGCLMPAVGLGTRKPKKPRQTYDAVKAALSVGYRHIDSASRYNNEDQVGEAVRDSGLPREAVWITTKIDNACHHRVAESVDRSLAALGLDYIDLLLMHWPIAVSPEDPSTAMPGWDFTQTWEEMQRVVASGRVRNIGVSNFGIRNLEKLLSHPACHVTPAVNQIELHPCCPSDRLVNFCRQRGIHCTAYSPLAFGLPQLHQSPALVELCKRTSKTPQQILIMWGLQRGTSVIPKSVTPERIATNFDLTGWALTPDEHRLLSQLDARCRVYPDDWLPGQAFWEEDN